MRLRVMVLLVAALPLVLTIAGVVWVVRVQLERLTSAETRAVVSILGRARRDELQHLVQAAIRGIRAKSESRGNEAVMQTEALEFLRGMDFGEDNYFVVYDLKGNCLMDARQPMNEGSNWWDYRDADGLHVIRKLIGQALGDGGFLEYRWFQPSTQLVARKLSYVERIPGWEWVVGTGLYHDQLQQAEEAIRRSTEATVRATRDQILFIACVALLGVGAGGLMLNLYEQRAADAKLRLMASRVVQAQDAERARVARELHDGVSQELASVKVVLESAVVHFDRGSEEAVGILRDGLRQLRGVMRDVRRISHDWRPAVLDDLGLAAAIEQVAREFGERTGVAVESDIQSLPVVSDALATTVFRVTQEALGNVERHASASRVELSLTHDRHGLTLRLSDNGRGFDVAAVLRRPREGLGLTNMRERFEMLGGRFDVRSSPGSTVVTATLSPQALK